MVQTHLLATGPRSSGEVAPGWEKPLIWPNRKAKKGGDFYLSFHVGIVSGKNVDSESMIDHIRHLRILEKALEKMERQKRQQQAAQVCLNLSVTQSGTDSCFCPETRHCVNVVNGKDVRPCAKLS